MTNRHRDEFLKLQLTRVMQSNRVGKFKFMLTVEVVSVNSLHIQKKCGAGSTNNDAANEFWSSKLLAGIQTKIQTAYRLPTNEW